MRPRVGTRDAGTRTLARTRITHARTHAQARTRTRTRGRTRPRPGPRLPTRATMRTRVQLVDKISELIKTLTGRKVPNKRS